MAINEKLWNQAEALLVRSDKVIVEKEYLGNEDAVYVAKSSILPVKSQGGSRESALSELRLAKTNYVYFRLLDGKDIIFTQEGGDV